jgi:sulfopyruvate decarboxylase TPP-binding subunit
MRLVTLSTEEEGMGIVTGLWMGGKRAMIAMQSSGVGNCINALGHPSNYRAPCLMLVTMRGQWGEFNPWQNAMGQAVRPCLEAVGVKCFAVDRAEEVGEVFAATADMAFSGNLSAAVLVSQRVIGVKGFGQK